MSLLLPTGEADRTSSLAAAVGALKRGQLVVLPTDTVYGVAADAFSPAAVAALLRAKGRGRDVPVPVLVGSWRALDGLAARPTPAVRRLVETFWPGPLTVVVRAVPSLSWDLGEARGTVALRMPLHPVALDVLEETGPLAVSSANASGTPPALDASAAREQLGDAVAVYLDAGPHGRRGPLHRRRLLGGQHGAAAPPAGRRPPGGAPAGGAARPAGAGGGRRAAARAGRRRTRSRDGGGRMTTARLLVVCTANLCRSPLGERLARAGLAARGAGPGVEVTSAGSAAREGLPMASHAAAVLAARGADAGGFASRRLSGEDVRGADLVLAASREHRAAAVTLFPRASAKTFTAAELARLVADVAPEEVTGDDAGQRLDSLRRAAASRRGLVVPARPADDDMADPVGGPREGFERTADTWEALLGPVLDLLVGPVRRS